MAIPDSTASFFKNLDKTLDHQLQELDRQAAQLNKQKAEIAAQKARIKTPMLDEQDCPRCHVQGRQGIIVAVDGGGRGKDRWACNICSYEDTTTA